MSSNRDFTALFALFHERCREITFTVVTQRTLIEPQRIQMRKESLRQSINTKLNASNLWRSLKCGYHKGPIIAGYHVSKCVLQCHTGWIFQNDLQAHTEYVLELVHVENPIPVVVALLNLKGLH